MREIDFRGKTLETNRWVYGYLTVGRVSGDATIESKDKTRLVDPATVGQFTGLTDKNERFACPLPFQQFTVWFSRS